jgi:hypothetical protein
MTGESRRVREDGAMKTWGRLKAVGLMAIVTGVVLVPLYGNPHRAPVTHSEWARMLLKGLQMDALLPASAQASQVFAILSWKNTLLYPADRFMRADGVEVRSVQGIPAVYATAATPGEVAYPVTVCRAGNYEIRLRTKGSQPVSTEILRSGDTKPAATFSALPNPDGGWVAAGKTHLDPGSYVASVSLPPGSTLQSLEVVPPCLEATEPPGGWRAAAIAQASDVAVTVLKALDRESELPGALSPVEVAGSNFQTIGPQRASLRAEGGVGFSPTGGPGGMRVMAYVDLPDAGLYTMSVLGIEGAGQSWLGDGCQKAVLCPSRQQSGLPQWRVLDTVHFTSGRHFFNVTLGAGAAIARLRLEKKNDGLEDYVETLKRLGLDVGPAGPITREKAVEAMKFVQAARAALLGETCGDVISADTLLAQNVLPEPTGQVPGPGVTPPSSGHGPPPLAPPAVPPQQPASPVVP